MNSIEKNRERRLRRALQKEGYRLYKSRTRNTHFYDLGGYRIALANSNGCVGGSRFELDLDDVEEFVKAYC